MLVSQWSSSSIRQTTRPRPAITASGQHMEGGSVILPEIIVDSGHQFTNGNEDFYRVYKGMVDAELARPPQAAIDALWWRDGNQVRFSASLTNLSGVTLSSSRNDPTLHAVVYEDVHIADTDRFARAATYTRVTNDLALGATANFSLVTPELGGVNWDKLHFLVLADYRPGGSSGAIDMLQTAVAVPAAFEVTPDAIVSWQTRLLQPTSRFKCISTVRTG